MIGLASIVAIPAGMIWGGHVLEHSPSFCGSCHEMQPSYDGWIVSGASKNHPTCIECHKGEGLAAVLESEVRGLRMIGIHFFGDLGSRQVGKREEGQVIEAKMPEAFCLKCHSGEKVVMSHVPFQTSAKTCADCHKHRVGWKFKGQVES